MKLLVFTEEFSPFDGGIGRYCQDLAVETYKFGHQVSVLTLGSLNIDHQAEKKFNFRIIRIANTKVWQLNFLFQFLYFILCFFRFRDYHILVTGDHPIQIIALFTLAFPLKYSITLHGTEILVRTRTRIRKWFFTNLCKKSQNITAVSNYTKKLLLNKVNLSENKVSVVYNGINVEDFSDIVDRKKILLLKKKLGIFDNNVILTVARLDPRKGHDIVIRALPSIIECVPSVKYIIVGTGKDEKRLKEIVSRYHLKNYVIFTGYIPDSEIVTYYDLCDVFVLPSRKEKWSVEGFGIVFLEAGIRGKPLIGANHGGVPEAIVNGETGFVVDPYDAEELARVTIKLLSDRRLAKEMGLKGKRRVFNHFTSREMARGTLIALGAKEG